MKIFGITCASKVASTAKTTPPEHRAALGTLLLGSPAVPWVQTYNDDGILTRFDPLYPLAYHQYWPISPSRAQNPEIGDPYVAAYLEEHQGALESLMACDWDLLSTMMCSEPMYTSLRNRVLGLGVDGYHIARHIGSLAPRYAASGQSRFNPAMFQAEITHMALLEQALGNKHTKWVTTPATKSPTWNWGPTP